MPPDNPETGETDHSSSSIVEEEAAMASFDGRLGARKKINRKRRQSHTSGPASTESIYHWLEPVREQRRLMVVVAAAGCCYYCCYCGNESASPKTERGMNNRKKRGGRGCNNIGWGGFVKIVGVLI